MSLQLEDRWLSLDLGCPHRVLSFAPHNPGYVTARQIVWREVRNADLPPDLDPLAWFAGQMAARGWAEAVGMLTSRDLSAHVTCRVEVEGVAVLAVATVGLGNAERIGRRRPTVRPAPGTINLAVQISEGLSDAALLEAMSIVASARAIAVHESGVVLADGSPASGTGTDCIAIAAPEGKGGYAGMHTAIGEALGRAVWQAVRQGAADWVALNGHRADGYPEDAV